MSFDAFGLNPRILAGVKAAGFTEPTPIQEKAVPVALQGRDVLGVAQTGTGKTAAFLLPILERLMTGNARRVRALILAPTRELAEQIRQMSLDLSVRTRIRTAAVYGGVSKGPQIQALRDGVEILVACPGRLLDLMESAHAHLSAVEILVLDEADRMCDMGFLPDIKRILARVPVKRQTMFFSATMPDDIRALADSILRAPVPVQIGAIAPVDSVSHAIYPVPDGLKTKLLLALLDKTPTGRALIFTRTKHRAKSLATSLEKNGFQVSALQGNMTQNRRKNAIDGFRSGRYDILVATDIAARGIDVSEISHVINFDMPDTVDAYTHRIGRTGRAARTGEAFTIANQTDGYMVREIERAVGKQIERRRLPEFDYGDYDPERQFQQSANTVPPVHRRLTTPAHAGRPPAGQRPQRSTSRQPAKTKPRSPAPRRPDGGKGSRASSAFWQ